MQKIATLRPLLVLLMVAFTAKVHLAVAQAEQVTLQANVDDLFAAWDRPDTPGAALAILHDGEVVYKKGYGMANLEYDVPISPTTIFPIASVSKQFTAFAIALLEDQGRLSLDDDIRTYLPELHDFGHRITLRHLIHHTSGLRDTAELMLTAGLLTGDLVTKSRVDALIYNQRDLNFDPGTDHLYSNTGYDLLAEIVAHVTGQPFSEWMMEHVFQPLGMTRSHVHDAHARLVKNRAYAYQQSREGGYEKNALHSEEVGATGVYTTVEDLAQWAHNLETGRVGGRAVSRRMQEHGTLNSGDTLSYAFGLNVDSYKGLRRVSHSGRSSGFLSNLAYFPDQRFAVIILSNLFPADPLLDPTALSMQVADLYLEASLTEESEAPLSKPTTFARPPAVALERVSGWYWNRAANYVRQIYVRDDTLRYHRNANSESALAPLGQDRFLMLGTPSHIIVAFEPSSQKPTRMLFIANEGTPTISEAVSGPSNPSEAALRAYEGTYFSEDIGTAYRFVVRGGRLVVEHPSRDALALTPVVRDHFRGGPPWWFGYDTHFLRDENNEVIGFRLYNFHAKKMRFDKIRGPR